MNHRYFPASDTVIALLVSAAILLPSAGSVTLINSGDWRDTFHAQNLAGLAGNRTFLVDNPGEARIAVQRFRNRSVNIITSRNDPGVAGLESRLAGGGKRIDFRESQYSLYPKYSSEVERFFVVNDRFSIPAASVLSSPISRESYILFYGDRTVEFLENRSKPAVFLGYFPSRPWKSLEDAKALNYRDMEALNRRFLERYSDTGELYLSERSSLNFEAITDETPVIFRDKVQRLSGFLKSENTDIVKVLGDENSFYASRLQDLTGSTGFVLKVGRTFTGGNLSSKVYGIKEVKLDTLDRELELTGAFYSNGNLYLGVENSGEIPESVELERVKLFFNDSSNRTEYFNTSITLPPGSEFMIPAKVEERPETAKVVAFSQGERIGGRGSLLKKPVKNISFPGAEASIINVGFDRNGIQVTVENSGERSLWVSVSGVTGEERFFTDKELLDGGESSTLELERFNSGTGMNLSNSLNLSLLAGPGERLYRVSRRTFKVPGTTVMGELKIFLLSVSLLAAGLYLFVHLRTEKSFRELADRESLQEIISSPEAEEGQRQ